MSEALIKADMFSNSPQERPEETVPEGGGRKKKKPVLKWSHVIFPPLSGKWVRVGGKLLGSLDQEKKKRVTVFFGHSLKRAGGMLLNQSHLIEPIRLLRLFFPPRNDSARKRFGLTHIKVESNWELVWFRQAFFSFSFGVGRQPALARWVCSELSDSSNHRLGSLTTLFWWGWKDSYFLFYNQYIGL